MKNLGRAEYENLKEKKIRWRTKKSLISIEETQRIITKSLFACLFVCLFVFLFFFFFFHFLNVFDLRFNFERDGETFGGTSESR